jgi:hypothetical protein
MLRRRRSKHAVMGLLLLTVACRRTTPPSPELSTSADATQSENRMPSIKPQVEATNGTPFIVVVHPPPTETWQHHPSSWVGPEGAHYAMVRFFTSSDTEYLGFEAQRISFPQGVGVPTAVDIAEGYRSKGAPGFTGSVVVSQKKARLLTDRGSADAIEIEGKGSFPNGKPGVWRSRIAVIDRTVLHTTVSASEGMLAAWVGLPTAYRALVAEREDVRDPQHPSLVTYGYIVAFVESSTVFMLDRVAEAEAVRKAQSVVTAERGR